jgi:hypothetical protein
MKRYRVMSFDFDTSSNILITKIQDSWSESIKKTLNNNKKTVIKGLIKKYGSENHKNKIDEFKHLSYKPFSVIAFHNKFFNQIRDAFVMGCYYPSLVASCSLGERILNHLIIKLRCEFVNSSEYKKIYCKDSFDNWEIAIDTLISWGVLLPEVSKSFNKLKILRNKSIHFNPEIDKNDRELALNAIKLLSVIIDCQFGIIGERPWFIKEITRATFVSKKTENMPFVKHIILPNCYLVGAKHKIIYKDGKLFVDDNFQYEDKEISDSEFCTLFNST